MNPKDVATIKSGLVTAQDKPPLEPFTPLKKAPPKFPYEEHALLPPDDARKVIKTKEALDGRAARIAEIEEAAKEMRVSTEQKIQEYKGTEGYEATLQEMNELKERLAAEVENTLDRVGKALIEQGDTVMTVYEQTQKGVAGKADIQKAMVEAITKYASKDVAGKIIKAADEAIASVVEANTKVKRRLASWPSPQNLRKKIKQELPKGAEASKAVTAQGIIEKIKGFFTDAFNWLKSVWQTVGDKLSGLVSSVDQAQPLVDQMKTLLGQVTTGASKKTAADVSEWEHDDAKSYVETLTEEFGEPSSIGKDGAVWQDIAGFKEVIVKDESIAHDKPGEHKDFVYSTMDIKTTPEDVANLAKASSSIIVDQLKGEVTARCGALLKNAVTLGFAQKVVDGEVDVENIEDAYAEAIKANDLPEWYKDELGEKEGAMAMGEEEPETEEEDMEKESAKKVSGVNEDALSTLLEFVQVAKEMQWADNVLDQMDLSDAALADAVSKVEALVQKGIRALEAVKKESSKKTADYRNSGDIFENRHEYAEAMIEAFTGGEELPEGMRSLFDNLVSAMSDSEAFDNFDYIAQNYDLYPTQDKRMVNADEFAELYTEEGVLKEEELETGE